MSESAISTHEQVPARTPRRRGTARVLATGCAGLILLVLAVAGLTVWDMHRSLVHSYQKNEAVLGTVLAEQTARAFQGIDLVVQATAAQVLTSDIETAEQFRKLLGDETTHLELVERLKNLPQAEALSLADASGTVINTSRFWPVAGIDVSDRDVYRRLSRQDS